MQTVEYDPDRDIDALLKKHASGDEALSPFVV